MSNTIKLKLHDTDEMVEIDISKKHHYENRVEVGLIITTQTLATDEDDSERLAEEVITQMVEALKDRLAFDYGMEINNYGIVVHETEEVE